MCKAELPRCGTVSGGRFAHKEEIEQLYEEKRGEEVGFVRKMLKTHPSSVSILKGKHMFSMIIIVEIIIQRSDSNSIICNA